MDPIDAALLISVVLLLLSHLILIFFPRRWPVPEPDPNPRPIDLGLIRLADPSLQPELLTVSARATAQLLEVRRDVAAQAATILGRKGAVGGAVAGGARAAGGMATAAGA